MLALAGAKAPLSKHGRRKRFRSHPHPFKTAGDSPPGPSVFSPVGAGGRRTTPHSTPLRCGVQSPANSLYLAGISRFRRSECDGFSEWRYWPFLWRPRRKRNKQKNRGRPSLICTCMLSPANTFGPPGQPNPATGKPSVAVTDSAIMQESLTALKRYNVVKATTSGPLEMVRKWKAAAPGRILAALLLRPSNADPDATALRKEFIAGGLEVLGEIAAQYDGLTLSDPELEPYLALAEELDIPVAIHTGFGPPGASYGLAPKLRAHLGNPLLIEEALVRHPKLRVYIMHAGFPFLEETNRSPARASPAVRRPSRDQLDPFAGRISRISSQADAAQRWMQPSQAADVRV